MSEHMHDPGGKVRIGIESHTVGDAHFSPCGRYRVWLSRTFSDIQGNGMALWIGMNPSTAAADVDDPTVRRETNFTRRWGLSNYLKTNVMDYRATHPRMLLEPGVDPCSSDNLPAIREFASQADLIVLAFGALHPKLKVYGEDVVRTLKGDGRRLRCLGLTKEGLPRHPLYIRNDAELVDYAA